MKTIKKIVLSAIARLVVTVGVYHIALLAGASEPAAVASAIAAFVLAAFVAAIAACVLDASDEAIPAFALAIVGVVALVAAAADDDVVVAITIAFFTFTAFTIEVITEPERVKCGWVAPVYAVQGLAIWGALAVGGPGWSVAIVLCGVATLLALLRAHSRFAALNAPSVVSAVPEQNGA